METIYHQSEIDEFNRIHGTDFLDIPAWKLKIKVFADKTVDYIATRTNFKMLTKEHQSGEQVIYPKELTDEEKERKRKENVIRASRRAKQAVTNLVRQMQCDHMLTLHTRENIQDSQRFDAIFKEFIRLVRQKDLVNGKLVTRTQKRDYQYVGVKELQERGALHMHLACVGKQDLKLLRACWYVALGGQVSDKGSSVKGQVDVQSTKKRFSGASETFKTMKLVQYLTKYITKTFEHDQELGKARYKASRGTPKPQIVRMYLPIYYSNNAHDDFVLVLKELNEIAQNDGVTDVYPWNRDLDIALLRGKHDF